MAPTSEHFGRVTNSTITLRQVRAYLPSNYQAMQAPGCSIVIAGHDNAGWTWEDYVKPRLASGLIFVEDL